MTTEQSKINSVSLADPTFRGEGNIFKYYLGLLIMAILKQISSRLSN